MMSDFEVIKQLGTGSFSSVYKVMRKSDRIIYALKKVKMAELSSKEKENALNEVRILASIISPNVIRYKDAFLEEKTDSLCIVLEYCDCGDIQSKINQSKKTKAYFDEGQIWRYIVQLLRGLKILHDSKILHRDIKGANIFLSNNNQEVKLGDLNVSKVAKNSLVYTQTGTPYYTSPEVWKGEAYNNKCDVWSLGCVIYEMMALNPPFMALNIEELYKKVYKGVYDRTPLNKYSEDLNNFVQLCLKVYPKQRPNIDQLLNLKIIKQYIQEDQNKENFVDVNSQQLLKTIKMPYGNLKGLKNMLPKPQFNKQLYSFDRPISAAENENSLKFNRPPRQPDRQDVPDIRMSPEQNSKPLQRLYSAHIDVPKTNQIQLPGISQERKQYYISPNFQAKQNAPRDDRYTRNRQNHYSVLQKGAMDALFSNQRSLDNIILNQKIEKQ